MGFEQLITTVEDLLQNASRSSVEGSFQFDITGECGGKFCIIALDGRHILSHGACPAPDATVRMTLEDALSLVKGTASAVSLYFGGRIKIEGNVALVLRIASLLG